MENPTYVIDLQRIQKRLANISAKKTNIQLRLNAAQPVNDIDLNQILDELKDTDEEYKSIEQVLRPTMNLMMWEKRLLCKDMEGMEIIDRIHKRGWRGTVVVPICVTPDMKDAIRERALALKGLKFDD